MKKRYIKPESKVLILTEKYAVLEDTVSITSSGDDGRHGNSKGHNVFFDDGFDDDNAWDYAQKNSIWD
ncbi:MAG: hypothetical protein ACI3YG_07715 [Prevotella sp.]